MVNILLISLVKKYKRTDFQGISLAKGVIEPRTCPGDQETFEQRSISVRWSFSPIFSNISF